ncbi:unnamed protein product [Rotaria sordida]|uniref:Uncharacterized protein n=1 Tax=Rotaria sordida TaxID=392033 RepID=A0A815C6J7_9BILA|nr:unnamed protein product [Rotaria sordida]CAF1512331.1 unnamed protein product [Rotaria sordida]CAF1558618.1 unnamed protein product [Rotaria sordida]CAF1658931.1 unnamed protein product [Rotaria sordida]
MTKFLHQHHHHSYHQFYLHYQHLHRLNLLHFFHYNILEGIVYLLAYINDILIGLKHLSTINDSTSLKSPLKLDESGDDEDDDSQDDEDINIDKKKQTLLSSTIQSKYDRNK